MKKTVVIIWIMLLLSLTVCAQSDYETQLQSIGGQAVNDGLDQSVRELFEDSGINIADSGWVNRLTDKNVLSHIWQFVTGGIKNTVKTGVLIAAIIFLSAALSAFGTEAHYETAIYAAVLAVGAIVASDIWQCISAAIAAIKGCTTFMIGFIPVFGCVLALSGKTVTAPAMSALLLGAAEAVSYIASFAVLPLISGYLSLSISSGVSPLLSGSGIAEGVKKLSMWIMSLFGTLFVGVLGIQTAVNSAADTVALRTARFILGTSVPVAGNVLAEAASTISSSMGLLKSSIGIYGVVALALLLLPIIIELLLWRAVLMLNISLGELFSQAKITLILRAVDSALSVLMGVVLTVGGMFIISLSVVVMSTK